MDGAQPTLADVSRYFYILFLAHRDEYLSYCRTVGVRDRVHKIFNLAYNSWNSIGRVFIFHMFVPCDKTFPWIPNFWHSDLEVWPTFINFNLGYSFLTKRGRAFICTFLVTRPFHCYKFFWPSDLNLEVWPTFKKRYPLPKLPSQKR